MAFPISKRRVYEVETEVYGLVEGAYGLVVFGAEPCVLADSQAS